MRSGTRLALAALAFALASLPAQAQDKLKVGYTAVSDYAAAFAAVEEGFFKKRNLDVELQLIALNSTIPAALQSGSIQVGGPTPPVFLQAVDGGLDHVVVAGGSLTDKSVVGYGVVARTGSGIEKAQDFQGKRVGAPGLNAFLHVLFRKWLMDQGVDPKRVTFVEVPFPQMNDVLRGGTVDAVVTGEPIMSRIVAAGTGKLVSNMTPDLAEAFPAVIYATTRDFATKNPDVVKRFRESIAEGAQFVAQNIDKARPHIAKYTRLPLEIVVTVPPPNLSAEVTTAHLDTWVKIMTDQDMLRGKPDPAKLNVR